MKNVIALLVMAALAWYGYGQLTSDDTRRAGAGLPTTATPLRAQDAAAVPAPQFTCDGRTHCSAMTSCAEATFFIQNCPNTRMDGNNDGIPCEQQWCK